VTDKTHPRTPEDNPGFDTGTTPALLPAARTPPHDAPLWAWIAYTEHRRTIAGQIDQARLGAYFSACQIALSAESYGEVPRWGSAFMCWCMEQAGVLSTRHVSGRTWLRWGKELQQPRYGAPAVYWVDDPKSLAARCGFWVGGTATWDYCLGGDHHTPAPTIARYPRAALLGYRWIS